MRWGLSCNRNFPIQEGSRVGRGGVVKVVVMVCCPTGARSLGGTLACRQRTLFRLNRVGKILVARKRDVSSQALTRSTVTAVDWAVGPRKEEGFVRNKSATDGSAPTRPTPSAQYDLKFCQKARRETTSPAPKLCPNAHFVIAGLHRGRTCTELM
jgi:hypothetical protein